MLGITELDIKILTYFNIKTLRNIALINKYLNHIINEEKFWFDKFNYDNLPTINSPSKVEYLKINKHREIAEKILIINDIERYRGHDVGVYIRIGPKIVINQIVNQCASNNEKIKAMINKMVPIYAGEITNNISKFSTLSIRISSQHIYLYLHNHCNNKQIRLDFDIYFDELVKILIRVIYYC